MSAVEPRRLTPTERSHEALLAAITRPVRADAPSFKIAQVKGVGGSAVYEWDVSVPVCEEYPTASKAIAAAMSYAVMLREVYPPPPPNGAEPKFPTKPQARKPRGQSDKVPF